MNHTMGSDHIPIVVTINIRPDQQVNSVPRWKLAKADWDIFRTVIETYTNKIPIDVSDDIDQLNDSITHAFQKAAKRLTWKQHIDNLIVKSKKRLNLMRAVSGWDWGASHNSLLTIYRTLIRSILDYGAIAYDSTTDTHLTRLDRVQHSALSLCCGAMKGTPTSALEVESRMKLHSD